MKVILKLTVPAALDQWLWKNVRAYRRHEIRRRRKVIFPFEFRVEPGSVAAMAEQSEAFLLLELARLGYLKPRELRGPEGAD